MAENEAKQPSKRGGARPNSGRKVPSNPLQRKRVLTANLRPFHVYIASVLADETGEPTSRNDNGVTRGLEAALDEVASTRGLTEDAFLALPDAEKYVRGSVRKKA